MISRRDFLQATAAAGLLVGASGFTPLARLAAQQKLTQSDLLRFDPLGNVTIVYMTDVHAQLMPMYFREPSVNVGVGEAKGRPPHLVDDAFLQHFGLASGSPDAYAFTAKDYEALAKTYGKMGGMDRVATVVKAIRAERGADKVLLLDGGDTWQGSWTSLQTKGQDMVDVQKLLGVEAMVPHWEFTYGAERVLELVDKLGFPFLGQNVRDKEFGDPAFKGRHVFEKGGAKIAVVGQAFPRTPISNPAWMIPKWEFGLREEDIQKEVDDARAEGADIVVLLSHDGFDLDAKLATRVKGIDVLLTAHTHDAMPKVQKFGDTLLVAAGSAGKFVARLDLDVQDKKLKDFRFHLIPIFSDAIEPDKDMAGLIQKIRAPYEKDLNRVLGHTESLLYRRGTFNGTYDDLICQAMLKQRDAQISLSPGFRWGDSLTAGSAITFDDLSNATAMTYPACYRMEMTGAQLKATLEDIADNIFNPDPYFQGGGDMVRVGGVGYAIDVSGKVGERISEMTELKTGKPIDADRKYVVAGWASVNQNVEGPPIWEVVEKHLADVKTVSLEPNTSVKVTGA